MSVQVTMEELPQKPLLSLKAVAAPRDVEGVINELFRELVGYANARSIPIAGDPFTIRSSIDSQLFELQVHLPIENGASGGHGRMGPFTVEVGPQAACSRHIGSYERLEDTYLALRDWINGSDYQVAGVPREVYRIGQARPQLVTEHPIDIVWPVRRREG